MAPEERERTYLLARSAPKPAALLTSAQFSASAARALEALSADSTAPAPSRRRSGGSSSATMSVMIFAARKLGGGRMKGSAYGKGIRPKGDALKAAEAVLSVTHRPSRPGHIIAGQVGEPLDADSAFHRSDEIEEWRSV